ncbi:aromatic amino acid transport family protein [Francisellaceae bacterium CB300]
MNIQNKPSKAKFIGCVLLIISSMIGGGIFALPIMAFKLGILATIILTLIVYAIMTVAGLFVVEISIKLPPYQNHYASLSYHAFGRWGKAFALIAFSVAIYATLIAYISAVPTLIGSNSCNLDFYSCISPSSLQILFTFGLGIVLICGMRYSENINRIIMTIKLCALVIVISLMIKYIDIQSLFLVKLNFEDLIQVSLIIVLAFAYQSILPSIVNYMGRENKKQIKQVIIIGTIITCIIYLLWTIGIASYIQHVNAQEIFKANPSLEQLVSIIKTNSNGSFTVTALNTFLNVTLFASFITISIAFIDFWIDALNLDSNIKGRIIAGLVALVPSLLVAIFFKSIFVVALAVSGFAGVGYSVLLPSAVAYKLYDKYNPNGSYFFHGGKNIRLILFVASVVFLIIATIF